MNTTKKYKLIAALVLLIASLIVADTFLLPMKKITEVKEDDYMARSRTSTTHSYKSYFIVSRSKHTYLVTEDIWASLTMGNSFIIYQSFIFHKPVKLSWCEEGQCYIQNIGTMNKTIFSYPVLAFLIIWPLLALTNIINVTNPKHDVRNLGAVIGSAGTFAFYLWY